MIKEGDNKMTMNFGFFKFFFIFEYFTLSISHWVFYVEYFTFLMDFRTKGVKIQNFVGSSKPFVFTSEWYNKGK